VTVLLIY